MEVRVDNCVSDCPAGCPHGDVRVDTNELFAGDVLYLIDVVVECSKRDVCKFVGGESLEEWR